MVKSKYVYQNIQLTFVNIQFAQHNVRMSANADALCRHKKKGINYESYNQNR